MDIDRLLRQRARPLCVWLDEGSRVQRVEGDAAGYGYSGLIPGSEGAEHLPFIVGLDRSQALDMMFMETPNGRSAEVRWQINSEGGWTVLLLDQSDLRDQLRDIQTAANEARLHKYRLQQVTEKLRISQQELQGMVYRDSLTGLFNHRAFHEALEREIRRQFRDGLSLALILADVDYFKVYNDHYGHLPGDDCLRAVAEKIEQQTRRASDLTARVGGEEFAMLLPNTTLDQAMVVARRMCRSVEAAGIEHAMAPLGIVTISVGVAFSPGDSPFDEAKELYRQADDALYQAKDRGRNSVVCLSPSRN